MLGTFRKLAFVVLAGISCGCAHRDHALLLADVSPGMPPIRVQSILGPPTTVHYKLERSAWLYCDDTYGLRPHTALIVWFYMDRLNDISVVENNQYVWCSDFLQAFVWADPNNYSTRAFK